MKKKYILKNKRRFILIIAILISIIFSTLIIATTRTKGYAEPQHTQIVVAPGDTLWDIVCEYYGNNVDIRRKILSIRNTNKLVTSELQVGQVLLLPAK